jgi:hypothetical protein
MADRRAEEALQKAVSDVLMRCFSETWSTVGNVRLWLIVLDGTEGNLGRGTVTVSDIERLRDLSRRAGGWLDWPRRAPEPVFHSFGSWKLALTQQESSPMTDQAPPDVPILKLSPPDELRRAAELFEAGEIAAAINAAKLALERMVTERGRQRRP